MFVQVKKKDLKIIKAFSLSRSDRPKVNTKKSLITNWYLQLWL